MFLIAGPLARELNRPPGVICTAIADLCEQRLRKPPLSRLDVDPRDGYNTSSH